MLPGKFSWQFPRESCCLYFSSAFSPEALSSAGKRTFVTFWADLLYMSSWWRPVSNPCLSKWLQNKIENKHYGKNLFMTNTYCIFNLIYDHCYSPFLSAVLQHDSYTLNLRTRSVKRPSPWQQRAGRTREVGNVQQRPQLESLKLVIGFQALPYTQGSF